LVVLGKFTAPIAEQGGLGRPVTDTRTLVSRIMEGTQNFEIPGLFSRFLGQLLFFLSQCFKQEISLPGEISYRDIWKSRIREAETAAGIFHQNAALTLERLFTELKREMIDLCPETRSEYAGGGE
jgi:hypothetical protein